MPMAIMNLVSSKLLLRYVVRSFDSDGIISRKERKSGVGTLLLYTRDGAVALFIMFSYYWAQTLVLLQLIAGSKKDSASAKYVTKWRCEGQDGGLRALLIDYQVFEVLLLPSFFIMSSAFFFPY